MKIIEKVMNRFGWYKLPRYFIYKIKNDNSESAFGSPSKGKAIFNYYEMLQFTSMLNNLKEQKIKYRIERISLP